MYFLKSFSFLSLVLVAISCGKEAHEKRNLKNTTDQQTISYNSDLQALLLRCIKNNDTLLVQQVLAQGVNPDFHSDNGEVPIVEAVLNSKTEIVEALIKNGANPNIIDGKGRHAYFAAIEANSLPTLKTILPKINDINLINNQNENGLMLAIRNNNQLIANFLVQQGIDLNFKDGQGKTALQLAKVHRLHITFELISNVIKVNKKGISGEFILELINEKAIESLKYMAINYPLRVYLNGHNYINTILDLETKGEDDHNKARILNILLKNGVSPNGENDDTIVPIIAAVKAQDKKVVRTLYLHLADINKQDEYGMTALVHATKMLDLEMINSLLYKGAKVEYDYKIDNATFTRSACSFIPKYRKTPSEIKLLIKKVRSRLDC